MSIEQSPRMGRCRPRASAAARRSQILRCAAEEFARRGPDTVTIHVIAGRAGLSPPYVLRLFRTKRGLLLATIEHGFDRLAAALADDDPDPAVERELARDGNRLTWLLIQGWSWAARDADVARLCRSRLAQLPGGKSAAARLLLTVARTGVQALDIGRKNSTTPP